MKRNVIIALLLGAAALNVNAQGRGSAAPTGQRGGQGQAQAQGQQPRSGPAAPASARDMKWDRLRAQRTDQQRDQYRSCEQSTERTRAQARDMARTGASAFNVDQARQGRDHLREQIQNLQREHERLMVSLGAEQRNAVEARTRNLQQIQERLNVRLRQMDQELAKSAPDAKGVSRQAQLIEREIKNWQNQHRRMGDELGLSE